MGSDARLIHIGAHFFQKPLLFGNLFVQEIARVQRRPLRLGSHADRELVVEATQQLQLGFCLGQKSRE